ncbi:MAG: helix-turn-helix transcriptional regulator [Clostridia bacterium]|nr:helix-turn-helix transcriptional regulator [Clostridia bacterium]
MKNSLGEFVRERRLEMGMSLREFAALCKVSHTHIDSIEKGYDVRSGRAVNLTSTTIKKLALALGVKEAELMKVNLGENTEVGKVTDSELKYALFGDSAISDSMLDEVKKFAEFIKSRGDT